MRFKHVLKTNGRIRNEIRSPVAHGYKLLKTIRCAVRGNMLMFPKFKQIPQHEKHRKVLQVRMTRTRKTIRLMLVLESAESHFWSQRSHWLIMKEYWTQRILPRSGRRRHHQVWGESAHRVLRHIYSAHLAKDRAPSHEMQDECWTQRSWQQLIPEIGFAGTCWRRCRKRTMQNQLTNQKQKAQRNEPRVISVLWQTNF